MVAPVGRAIRVQRLQFLRRVWHARNLGNTRCLMRNGGGKMFAIAARRASCENERSAHRFVTPTRKLFRGRFAG